jgi:Na+-driven multidrug efflux pump
MSSSVSSGTEPAIRLDLIRLWWPLLVERLTGGLVTFVDTLFISQISDKAAASIGMLNSVLWLGYFILPQFTNAGTSVAAQYIGAKKPGFVVATYWGNLLLSTGSGLVLCLALLAASGFVGLWYGMTAEQNSYAQQYLSVIAFNFILVGLRGSYASVLASKTLTKWNMANSVLINVLNIALASVLSRVWGIPGIALATVISYAASATVLFVLVHYRLRVRFFIENLWDHTRAALRAIARVGVPSALEPLSYTVQGAIVAMMVIGLGYVFMGANAFVRQLLFFDLAVSWSLTSAGQIIMSHQLGSKQYTEVDKTYFRVLSIAAGAALVIVVGLLVFHRPLLSWFTHDESIIATGFWLLVISLGIEPIRVANILGGIALKTVGDGKFSLVIGLIFMWGVVPLMLVANLLGTGIIGFWVCLLLDEAVRAVINVVRWKGGRWRTKSVIEA